MASNKLVTPINLQKNNLESLVGNMSAFNFFFFRHAVELWNKRFGRLYIFFTKINIRKVRASANYLSREWDRNRTVLVRLYQSKRQSFGLHSRYSVRPFCFCVGIYFSIFGFRASTRWYIESVAGCLKMSKRFQTTSLRYLNHW